MGGKVMNAVATALPKCPICGASATPWKHVHDQQGIAKGEWLLLRCQQCKAGFLHPRPKKEEISSFYPDDYYAYLLPSLPAPPSKPLKRLEWQWRQKRIQAYLALLGYPVQSPSRFWKWLVRVLPPSLDVPHYREGVLLDIGCGSGQYLLQMREWGWKIKGVEINPRAVHAARKAGLDVIAGTLEEAQLPSESIAFARLGDVLEHVPDPVATMKEIHRILEPGGLVEVITPNLDSWGFSLFGKYWFPLETPRHIVLFTPQAIRALAQQTGFHIHKLKVRSHKEVDVIPSIHAWLADAHPKLLSFWDEHPGLQKLVRKLFALPKTLANLAGKGSMIVAWLEKAQ